jgi:hypothetical protein
VELNLEGDPKAPAQGRKVHRWLVRGVAETEKPQPGKHDDAVFLTMDLTLSAQNILEIDAMRWAILVSFKEAKPHLGFLQEQSGHYAASIASLHLTAIRYCLLALAQLQPPELTLAGMRKTVSDPVTPLDFASRLWGGFRSLIERPSPPHGGD